MTVYLSELIASAGSVLKDSPPTRWVGDEYLQWWNDGKRDICVLKPDACSIIGTITCVNGTRQSLLTAEGERSIALGKIISATDLNLGVEIPVQGVDRRELDAANPLWHAANAESVPLVYTIDRRWGKKTFYVSPPIADGSACELTGSYVVLPEDSVMGANGYLGIALTGMSDAYAAPLLDYMLFRAYAKTAAFKSGHAALSNKHYSLYTAALGREDMAEAAFAPKMTGDERSE